MADSSKNHNMGRRIQECLDEKGWKQADLVGRVPGLERATLSIIIKRDSKKSEYASAIARALGVRLAWLMYGEGEKYPQRLMIDDATEDHVMAVQLLEKLSPEQRAEWFRWAIKQDEQNQALKAWLLEQSGKVVNGE